MAGVSCSGAKELTRNYLVPRTDAAGVRMFRILVLISSMAAAAGSGLAQDVQKLDPALDQLIDSGAKAEQIATGFNKWTEGPVWTHAQSLLFAEIPANNIIQWRP